MTWKSLLALALTFILIYFIASINGCYDKHSVNVNYTEDSVSGDTISGNTKSTKIVLGYKTLVPIGEYVYYDNKTFIVYWWNGTIDLNQATTPTPYYAPNGLPYRYNPSTNTIEEIPVTFSYNKP